MGENRPNTGKDPMQRRPISFYLHFIQVTLEGMLWALNAPNGSLTLVCLDEKTSQLLSVWMKRGHLHSQKEWLIRFRDQQEGSGHWKLLRWLTVPGNQHVFICEFSPKGSG